MKKFTVLALFLFAFTAATFAQDYMKMKIWELAGTADVVLRGKVSAAKGTNVSLDVEEVIMGDFSGKSLDYSGSKGYKTAKRHAKYTPGEELLIFFKQEGDELVLMGQAGEGEKLVMGDKIYLDSRGEGIFNKFNYHTLAVADQKLRDKNMDRVYAEEMALSEFVEAIKAYPGCFSVGHEPRTDKMGNVYEAAFAEQKCSDKELDDYRFISLASDKLAELSLKAVK